MTGIGMLPVDRDEGRHNRPLVACRFTPTEVDLFMFCAAVWNTHRIHFDRDFARAEGYRDLVVPGPMQSARLGQMVGDFAAAHDGRLATMSVRHRTPLYCNESVDLRADAVGVSDSPDGTVVELSVAAQNGAGELATSGTATIVLAATARSLALVRSLGHGAA
jgi:hydroxyacyl-ACP dehydratase HTD2-like protein with hotdog domain